MAAREGDATGTAVRTTAAGVGVGGVGGAVAVSTAVAGKGVGEGPTHSAPMQPARVVDGAAGVTVGGVIADGDGDAPQPVNASSTASTTTPAARSQSVSLSTLLAAFLMVSIHFIVSGLTRSGGRYPRLSP